MAKIIQPTFTGGEMSPSLYARVDIARYGTSVKKAKNFLVRPYGGLVNRPGFGYVGEVKNSAQRVRLIPFRYSSEIAYVIEMGPQYMRFIYQGAYVVDGGNNPVEIATPWQEDELREVAFTQSADVLYLVHPSYPPIEVRRTSASTFEARYFANKNGPFGPINADEAIKVAVSAETGPVTVTANADIFQAGHVGSLFYVEEKDLRGQRPWEANWRNPALGTLCRSDGKVYRCSSVPSGGTWYQTGGQRPIHDSGKAWDGPGDARTSGSDTYYVGVEWEYLHAGYGIIKITGFVDAKTVTGEVMLRIPSSCVGGLGSPGATWNHTGDGSTTTFSIPGATSNSVLDYQVTIAGAPVRSNPYYTPPGGIGGGAPPGGGEFGPIYEP